MYNPVGSSAPAPAAASLSNNKRKESEVSELDIIQKYFDTHTPEHKYWSSYVGRLITLQELTPKEDPAQAKLVEYISKFFNSQGTQVPTAAPAVPAPEVTPRARKTRKEDLYEKTYKLKVLREQIKSIKENINNNEIDLIKREDQKGRGLCQLADLFDKFPENEEVAALYKEQFPDVNLSAESEPAQTTETPVRSTSAQQLSDEYDALRKTNMEIELLANDKFEALSQLQGLPVDKNVRIYRMDERFLAFSKSIDKVIALLEAKPIDVFNIMIELSVETRSLILEAVRNQIISAIANSSVTITKEWLLSLLQECSYGSEDAPLDATPEQIRLLIQNEKNRHKLLMEKLNRSLQSAPEVSLLLHLSLPGSQQKK